MDTKTTVGTMPVMIEFAKYNEISKSFLQKDEEIRKIAVQYIGSEVPNYLKQSQDIKSQSLANLDVSSIASLLVLNKMGHAVADESGGFAFYNFNRVGALCRIQEKFETQSLWKI